MSEQWRTLLTDRQLKEVQHAEYYMRELNHGTVGHNMLELIALMAQLLDNAEGDVLPKGVAARLKEEK